jgi:predicted acyltransferase
MLSGFAAHWEFNTNPAAVFDRWFLNLFPRSKPYPYNPGGYTTLNFIPSIVTMLLGVVAGDWLRSNRTAGTKILGLSLAGAVCLVAGSALDPICPVVKRIWTPSWVIYSTAWTCWLLALFYTVIDVWKLRGWAFPLVVVGLNSIAMYLMAQLLKPFTRSQVRIHVGTFLEWLGQVIPATRQYLPAPASSTAKIPDIFGGTYGPIIESLAVLLVLWLVCLWMYRRRIFLRI